MRRWIQLILETQKNLWLEIGENAPPPKKKNWGGSTVGKELAWLTTNLHPVP